jgi:hypothetical protein
MSPLVWKKYRTRNLEWRNMAWTFSIQALQVFLCSVIQATSCAQVIVEPLLFEIFWSRIVSYVYCRWESDSENPVKYIAMPVRKHCLRYERSVPFFKLQNTNHILAFPVSFFSFDDVISIFIDDVTYLIGIHIVWLRRKLHFMTNRPTYCAFPRNIGIVLNTC